MNGRYNHTVALIQAVSRIVRAVRRQDYDLMNRIYMREFTGPYQIFLQQTLAEKDILKTKGVQIEESFILESTKLVMNAQEQKDYVLMADYLELLIMPFVQSILVNNRETNYLADLNYEQENRELFRDINKSVERDSLEKGEESEYCIEPTNLGPPTLKKIKGREFFYFHSNVNPWQEADFFVQRYGQDRAVEYAVLGLGLGYHVIQLWNRTRSVPVHVYEPDAHVLLAARRYQDFSVCGGENLQIHYDIQLKQLAGKIKQDGVQLVLHQPSLRNVKPLWESLQESW